MLTVPRVAAPDLRIVRRRRGALTAAVTPTPNSLVAASSPVNSVKDIFKSSTMGGRRQLWQDEAWQLFDDVGELGCYVRWRARSCSRVKLVASEIDPDTGQPTGGILAGNAEGAKVAAIVHSIAGGPLGQAEFIENAVHILSVPGEFFTAIIVTETEGERWLALSRQQIKPSQKNRDGITIVLPEGGEHEFTPRNADGSGRDGMFRVWNPHPKNPTEATSPVRSNLTPLREIVRTTVKMENADNSRIANNGFFVFPQEASLPNTQAPVSAGKPGDTSPDSAPQQSVSRTLTRMVMDVNEAGLKNPNGPESVIPVMIGAPGEHLDKIKHIQIGKDISEMEIKKRDAAILRFARGIDMEPDQLLGLGDTNHWNGHLLADQDVQLHVTPVMKTLCQAFYRNVIGPMLVKMGIDPRKYILWIDASDLTVDPDKTDEAKDAFEKGVISSADLRRYYGLKDDDGYGELSTLDDYKKLAKDKLMAADPAAFAQLLHDTMPLLDSSVQSIDFPDPQPALPAGQYESGPSGDPGPYKPVDSSPPSTEGVAPRKPVTAAVVATVEDVAADSYLTHALSKAGNRRVKVNDRAQFERLRSVEPHRYHQLMPPVTEAEADRLIAGYDTGLDDMADKYGFSADQVRSFVIAEARKRLTSQVVDG